MSELAIFSIFSLATVGAIAGLFALAVWGESASCSARASKMELAKSWGVLQGCMVRVDNKWTPIRNIQVIRIQQH
jgi:hypothetical protein